MSRRRAAALLGATALIAALPAACRGSREPFLTYFNGEHALSLRYPAAWKTEQAAQDGVWYRHFLGPPEGGPQPGSSVSVTLLAGPLGGSLEDYAQVYLAGSAPASSKGESRQGARGMSLVFTSAGGQKRHWLLLLEEAGTVYGLHAQGDAEPFARREAILQEMFASFTLERPDGYAESRDASAGFSIRVPTSWKSTRSLSADGKRVMQFLSPALRADPNRQIIHASLALSVEPVGGDGGLDAYYAATRRLLGGSFQLLDHTRWKDGYADVMHTETPVSASRLKRFYRVANGRGYSLMFEAREDLFDEVVAWFDLIAGTLRVGPELEAGRSR